MPNRPSHAETLAAIEKVKARLKTNETVRELFKKYKVDIEEIDTIPVCFAELDVSARTDHAIIYLNWDMFKDGDISDDDHYLTHEITHYLQQTTGDGPTEGSTDDTYLDNEFEQEGFQMQTKYLSETRDDDAAEDYIEKVLDHHDVPNEERNDRKKELLELAASRWLDQLRVVASAASQSFFSTQSLYKTAAPGDETWNQQEGRTFWGKQGAGLLLICLEDQTAFLLQRSQRVEEPGTWGIAGGAIGSEEESVTGAIREAEEELGSLPNLDQLLDTVTFTQGNFKYDTLIYSVSAAEKKKWTPNIKLNWENDQYRWFPLDALPTNLHFGVEYVKNTYKERGIDVFEDTKNEYDWIRAEFRKMFYAGRVEKSIVDDISAAAESADQKTLAAALDRAGKWFVSNKDMDGLRQTNKMKRMLVRGPGQNDWDKPKHEKSQYERYLYHGTDAADALSILKNNTFIKGTAFDRVSFTSDLGIAFKFGDVVFVFDGKKVQRAGAKKMRYYDIDTLSKLQQTSPKLHDEDAKRPKISDIYSNEKEWAIPLPWTFDSDMLDHIIVASARHSPNGRKKAELIKAALESATDKPVRVQSPVSYGYSPSDSDTSKLQVSDAKYAIFNYIAKPMNEFLDSGRKYIENEKKRLKEKYPNDSDEMILYTLKNYGLYPFINTVYREKQELEATFRNPSRHDARRILNLKKNLARPLAEFQENADRDPIVSQMASALVELMNGVDVVVETMSETYLKTEDDYKNMMTGYNSSADGPFLQRFQTWLESNSSQLESLVSGDGSIYESNYNNPTAYAIKGYLDALDDPRIIPDRVWMRFPFTLIDSRNAHKMPTSRLRTIIAGNPNIQEKFKEEGPRQWIEEYRLGYAPQGPEREHWIRVQDILEPKQFQPTPVNTEPEQE